MFLKDSMQRMTSTGAMESASIIARATARSLDEGIALEDGNWKIGDITDAHVVLPICSSTDNDWHLASKALHN